MNTSTAALDVNDDFNNLRQRNADYRNGYLAGMKSYCPFVTFFLLTCVWVMFAVLYDQTKTRAERAEAQLAEIFNRKHRMEPIIVRVR